MREAVLLRLRGRQLGRRSEELLTTPWSQTWRACRRARGYPFGHRRRRSGGCYFGCGFPEGATGHNVARQCALKGGLPVTAGGTTINRFCSSGLQAISIAAQRVLWTMFLLRSGRS
ncbi:MAG: hypothetical protein CM15mP62_27100 [Rhodospirillaceae bacterium]|nr:MAG: hypothetical protein CM15mP62_27100 [Rhodospirillaceae bacterium]